MTLYALMLAAIPSQTLATTADASSATPIAAYSTWFAALGFLAYILVMTYREVSRDKQLTHETSQRSAGHGETVIQLKQQAH